MELARRLQFRRARRTARQMLLYFIAGVIFQLVINVENNVVLYPITFHVPNPSIPCRRVAGTTASPTTRCAVSAWRGTAYSSRSLRWCSAFRRRSATSIRDSASTQKPCARGGSASKARRRSCVPVRGASDHAPDSLLTVHRQPDRSGCILRRSDRSRPEHLLS